MPGFRRNRHALNRIFQDAWHQMSLAKLPIYIAIALLFSYFAPAVIAIPFIYKTVFALLFSPILFETTVSFIKHFFTSPRTVHQPYVEPQIDFVQTHLSQNNLVNSIIRSAGLGNYHRARNLISQLTNRHALYTAILRTIRLDNNAANAIFPQLLVRIFALGHAHYLTHDQNALLINAIREANADIVQHLLEVPQVMQSVVRNPLRIVERIVRNGDMRNLEVLLSNPSLLARLTDDNNRILRTAQRFEQYEVIARLLLIPAVANFAYPPNFRDPEDEIEFPLQIELSSSSSDEEEDYQAPVRSTLGEIANNSEGSMNELTSRQQKALDDMKAKYLASYNAKGQENIFNEIKAYLRAEYERTPARNARGAALLLECAPNNTLSANEPYYKHIVHSAYRYLFMHPNPLSDSYPEEDDLDDEDQERIAYMWLAATDPNQPLPEGQSRESLLTEFAQAIYELCRAHNFDNRRWVEKQMMNPKTHILENVSVQEAYDDLEGDKATCGGGVTQRVTQFYMVFLNDSPQTRPLTADLMQTQFKEQMINESQLEGCLYRKLNNMSTQTLQAILAAMEKKFVMLDELTASEQRFLNRLRFTHVEVSAFEEHCHAHYGARRITKETTQENQIKFGTHRFGSYEQMIRHLAENAAGQFYSDIERNIKNIIDSRPALATPQMDAPAPSLSTHRSRSASTNDSQSIQEPTTTSYLLRSRNRPRRR